MATDWIQTLENRALFPRAIKAEQVGSIREIAHSLAHNFRFTRMLEQPYSVAEHCVRGARLLPKAFAGAFLLHELSEVYLPDIPAPLKPYVSVDIGQVPGFRCSECGDGNDRTCDRCGGPTPMSWAGLELQHTHVMLEALGLSSIEPLIYSPEVRAMDLAMLAAEKKWLVGPEPMPWGLTVEPPSTYAIDLRIVPWSSDASSDAFIRLFNELFR